GELRDPATRKLWAHALTHDHPPTGELIALVGRLPKEEARRLLDPKWEEASLRDAIVLALARAPTAADRSKFIEALASPQPQVVAHAARALIGLGMASSSEEMA